MSQDIRKNMSILCKFISTFVCYMSHISILGLFSMVLLSNFEILHSPQMIYMLHNVSWIPFHWGHISWFETFDLWYSCAIRFESILSFFYSLVHCVSVCIENVFVCDCCCCRGMPFTPFVNCCNCVNWTTNNYFFACIHFNGFPIYS